MFNLSNRRKAFRGGETEVFPANTSNLNGTNHHFTSARIIDTSSDFSAAFWIKLDTYNAIGAGNSTIMTDFSGISFDFILRYRNDSNAIRLSSSAGDFDATDFGALSLGVFYFIGISYNTVNGYKIIINTTVQSDASTTATNSSRILKYGVIDTSNTTQSLDGSIAMVKLYDETKSDSDFLDLYHAGVPRCQNDETVTSDIVSAWNIANTAGSTIPSGDELVDQSGNGNSLTNVNSVPYTASGLSVECTT